MPGTLYISGIHITCLKHFQGTASYPLCDLDPVVLYNLVWGMVFRKHTFSVWLGFNLSVVPFEQISEGDTNLYDAQTLILSMDKTSI